MDIGDIFKFLAEDVHTVIAATADDEGLPVTCAIDVMDYDGGGLYFLTAKGKGFYRRLISRGYAALTGIKGEDTMHRAAASVRGKVRPESEQKLASLIQKNAYMREIYPTEQSRAALAAFCLYSGQAEWFDLSVKPIVRLNLTFGGAVTEGGAYAVGDGCTSCGKCLEVCPQKCIKIGQRGAYIVQQNCLRCGNCMTVCPVGAVTRG